MDTETKTPILTPQVPAESYEPTGQWVILRLPDTLQDLLDPSGTTKKLALPEGVTRSSLVDEQLAQVEKMGRGSWDGRSQTWIQPPFSVGDWVVFHHRCAEGIKVLDEAGLALVNASDIMLYVQAGKV